MLTARLHLDNVTEENGPLRVIPGSHNSAKALQQNETKPHSILAHRGDVLLIRPLLTHGSGKSVENKIQHRRILHFEFAASPDLPDGYGWHSFHAGNETPANAICLKARL
jgi:ectoine hydroxylase-related dioxygenase (phytanoyl-CoA dioxygenase family)